VHAALAPLLPPQGQIAYVYDSHTVEDSQLLRYLGDHLESHGYAQLHVEPNQLDWQSVNPAAKYRIPGVDAIVRHYPAEWLEYLPGTALEAYFNSRTPAVNHPIAVIAQSKRLPLVWDKTNTNAKTWKSVLPQTREISDHKRRLTSNNWIYKPAFGRVGEGINIPGTVSPQENIQIQKTALANKDQWVQQKLFHSVPIAGLHLAIGAFVVNGKFAGCFARASANPIMNYTAKELPVLRKG